MVNKTDKVVVKDGSEGKGNISYDDLCKKKEQFRGCLIGGAIGDALGWPVEFLLMDEITHQFGIGGIQNLVLADSGKAEITDDTQMTLFTVEGILRSEVRGREKGICHPPAVVFYAYQRWLWTQGYPKQQGFAWIYDGWLLSIPELFVMRAPGNACLSALATSKQGTIEEPINDSKGCGGVMRVAPVGLFYKKEKAFNLASEIAAITHGNPSGYLSAGAFAYMIAAIIAGENLETAVGNTLGELKKHDYHEECTQSMSQALQLSKSNITDREAIAQLGEGWVGDEALGIAIYCALRYQNDFKNALIAAVNHDGDSDSTGAITGNILGAYMGVKEIPIDWLVQVELKEVLAQVSDDLFIGYEDSSNWWQKYPGY